MRRLLDHWRIPYLVLIAVVTLFTGYHCLGLKVDRENRSMESDDEELALVDEDFDRLFGEQNSVFVAVRRTGLLSEEGKKRYSDLVAAFARIDGVAEVVSLADTGFGILPFHEDLLISPDRETGGMEIRLEPATEVEDNGEALERIIGEIREVAATHSDDSTRIAVTGLPVEKYESARLVLRDQRLFSPLSFLVLGLILFLITRRIAGTLIPLASAGLTICWTLGLYSFLGLPLNMITSLLPPVIMTISVATTIHLYLEWARGDHGTGNQRILNVLKKLNLPCLFAALTTVIGFLSLLLSQTPAVRTFGVFAALGVSVGYVLGTTFLAVCLSYLHPKPVQTSGAFLSRILEKIAMIPIRHPRKVVGMALILAAVGAVGIPLVKNNTDLIGFLGPKNQLVRDTRFVEEYLTGTGAIELMVSKTDGTAFSEMADFAKVAAFQEKVKALPAVRHVLSPVDLFAAGGSGGPGGMASHLSADQGTVRMTVRCDSMGTRDGARLITDLRAIAAAEMGNAYRLREAGDFNRVIVESNELATSQVKSFGVAITLILLSIGIVFRSFLYLILAILPNVTPLLMTAAIMGFASIDLSTGTAMIASVVIGLAVDDTIHYMAAFRGIFDGGNCDEAIIATTRSSGFAIISTTLTLSAGFWIAIFGSFQPTVYFALLSGLTMWFALAFDLFVLPACLKLVFGRRKALVS